MSENKDVREEKIEIIENKRFDFMTNIFVPSHDRTTYVKFLSKYTMDGQVAYLRILMALFILSPILIFSIHFTLNNFDRLRYVIIPVLLFDISVILFTLNYLVNSRGESMLFTLFKLNNFKFEEMSARRSKNKSIDYAVKDILDGGVILFRNNRYGIIYEIEGVLSSSTLPSVVNNLHNIKREYMVGRTPTSEEISMSRISHIDLKSIMKNLERLKNKAKENNNIKPLEKDWIEYMSDAHRNFLKKNHEGKEFKMSQHLILVDDDVKELSSGIRNLSYATQAGMFSNIKLLDDPTDIIEALAPVTLLSKRGKYELIEKEKRKKEQEKFRKQ